MTCVHGVSTDQPCAKCGGGAIGTPAPRLDLRYTDPSRLSRLHHFDGDSPGDSIEVVGDPDNASYEWVVRRGDELKHSDVGYGMSLIALRDALVEYYGLPTSETAFTRTRKVPR